MGNAEYTCLPEWIAVRTSAKCWSVCQLAEQQGEWKTPDYTAVWKNLTEREAEKKLAEMQKVPAGAKLVSLGEKDEGLRV